MEPPTPWLTFATSPSGNTLTYHEPSFTVMDPALTGNRKPSIVTLVGKRTKAVLLGEMLANDIAIPVHKDVFLWSSPKMRGEGGYAPLVIIDCGIQNSHSQPPPSSICVSSRPKHIWSMPRIENFSAALCGHIFSPFSGVLCCFVSDLGGPRGVAKWLAALATAPKTVDLAAVPRVLLVLETKSDTFDERIAADKAADLLSEAMQRVNKYSNLSDVQRKIQSCFRSVEVLGLQSWKSSAMHAKALKRRLISMSDASTRERASTLTQFTYSHFLVLTEQLLHYRSTEAPGLFRFAHASRVTGFSTLLLEPCLADFLHQLPMQSWLWHFAAPIIASALLLSSYPPHSHHFSPDYLFNELYSIPCRAAIASYTPHADIQSKFVAAVMSEFNSIFAQLSRTNTASQVHEGVLSTHYLRLVSLKSHRSCFYCFTQMPEKVLTCGHALCNICIRIFGVRSRSERNTYELGKCKLCSIVVEDSLFRFIPPTAGIRMLTVDGGGVRGVVPLMYLQYLDESLAMFGCAVRDYFDFICGTSAGGLVVIGMFLLRWDPVDALQRFEETADKTFGKRKALLAKAVQLLVAYVEDGRYSVGAVQEAFKETFDTSLQMFNPLRNDTKVAVTTTDVQDALPWLFTNYNGGKRSGLGYDVVRAERSHDDITVSDAACCTSAAPWFFKPQAVQYLGTYQDGGLQHNNPASIAKWESRFIWPNKAEPDFALSLGTGTASTPAGSESWWKSRFTSRIFKSFMRTLDGEDAWKRFYNSLAPASRDRFHRLNIRFSGTEPSLDDALRIPELKVRALETIRADTDTVTTVLDYMIASMFYFELDDLPKLGNTGYACSGYIFCRLDLPYNGLHYLYTQLKETSSWFLIQGNPIPCILTMPKRLPPFKRRVTFCVDSLDENVAMSIRGITSTPKLLSGFPTSLGKLIDDQMLDSPFGTIDHRINEKALPAIPAKRDTCIQIQQGKPVKKRSRTQY